MAPPFVQRMRAESVRRDQILDYAETIMAAPDSDGIPSRPIPRARDNPFLRAAEDLGSQWEQMRQERDEARLAAERDRLENLRLSERVDALERELREKVSFLVEQAEGEKRRADDYRGQAEGFRAKFSVIAQALLHVMREDTDRGGVYAPPPPREEQVAVRPAPQGADVHPDDIAEMVELIGRLPPIKYPERK